MDSDCRDVTSAEFYAGGQDHLAPLWRIAEEDGTKEVVVTEAFFPDEFEEGTREQFEDTYICTPTREGMYALGLSRLDLVPQLMFPPDGRWMFFAGYDEDGFLAGEADVIDRFVDYYDGGLEKLQEILAEYMEPDPGYESFAKRELCINVFDYYGWPWPKNLEKLAAQAEKT